MLWYLCVNIAPAMSTKVTSLRLPEHMAAELAAVARADDMPISEAVRDAIEKHIAERRADENFQKRLKELLEEDQRVLRSLAE
jgi:metal-responsive CopG/Arc/MetJ family transcriptional regulator